MSNLDELLKETPSLQFDVQPEEIKEISAEEEQEQQGGLEADYAALTPEEQKQVDEFSAQIDITNTQAVLQYGAGCQKKIADFSETALGNVRNKDMGEIGEMLTPYQLASGEKQMLAILLTVLVEDNRNYVLFMDEPEVSLHVEWQERLIDLILELNPNVQIILTTHSPAVIMNGWADRVTEVSDITDQN